MMKSFLVPIVLCGLAMNLNLRSTHAEEKAAPAPEVEAAVQKNLGLPLRDLEKAYEGQNTPESVRMLLAISRGSLMGAGDGWFGPGAGRYSWDWLSEKLGVPDGAIVRDQFPGSDLWFSRLDRNKDGKIRADDFDWSESNPWVQQSYIVNRMFRRIDPTGDGRLSRDEWQAFFDKAGGGKDHLLMDDLRDALIGGASGGFLPGDAPSQEVLIRGLFAGELGSLQEGPRVGDQAPDFALKTHDGSRVIRLGEIVGEKPVVITFGNFTCGPFRSMFPGVEDVHKRFAEEAVFIAVYVREAHPTDGWKMESNARVGVVVAQPKSYDERKSVATQCHQLLKPAMPLLVDEINDPVGNAYSGMPARMYVIDRAGKVAYKGGRGPFGFKAGEMEQALVMTLLDGSKAPKKNRSPMNKAPQAVPDNEAAWRTLPPAECGAGLPLPVWGRALSQYLPRTTAALLQLDYLHRAASPLDPQLRSKLRYEVATANRSPFGQAVALADLRRAGLSPVEIDAWCHDELRSGFEERLLLSFARSFSLHADAIEDRDVADLISRHGIQSTVAIVLYLAFANLHDRILAGLVLDQDFDEPAPPVYVRFDLNVETNLPMPEWGVACSSIEPETSLLGDLDPAELPTEHFGREALPFDRASVPDDLQLEWDRHCSAPEAPPLAIVSRLVALGHQRQMAVEWSACIRNHVDEARYDPRFSGVVRWVDAQSLGVFPEP